jgi:hypothetical protein
MYKKVRSEFLPKPFIFVSLRHLRVEGGAILKEQLYHKEGQIQVLRLFKLFQPSDTK